MSKKKTKKTYWVPMKWEYQGRALVTATNAEEAERKAHDGEFNDGVEIHEAGAELINWEVAGEAKEEK